MGWSKKLDERNVWYVKTVSVLPITGQCYMLKKVLWNFKPMAVVVDYHSNWMFVIFEQRLCHVIGSKDSPNSINLDQCSRASLFPILNEAHRVVVKFTEDNGQ